MLGRWVSADPLAVHAPGEADLNLYAYVSGQILKNTDPLGLEKKLAEGVTQEDGEAKVGEDGSTTLPEITIEGDASDNSYLEDAGDAAEGAAVQFAANRAEDGAAAAQMEAHNRSMGAVRMDSQKLAQMSEQIQQWTASKLDTSMKQAGAQVEKVTETVVAVIGALRGTIGGLRGIAKVKAGGLKQAAQSQARTNAALSNKKQPGAVSAMESPSGERVVASSAKGRSADLDPQTQSDYDSVPQAQRSPYHSKCAEGQCLSAMRKAGIDPRGGKVATVDKRGETKPPCSSCDFVLKKNNIKVEE